jgi:hypothetical protein
MRKHCSGSMICGVIASAALIDLLCYLDRSNVGKSRSSLREENARRLYNVTKATRKLWMQTRMMIWSETGVTSYQYMYVTLRYMHPPQNKQ